ncbi:MAG: NADH-ubiquinone oxidoreductase-F iron-sulfur binding region domain-containing protein [Candidatus Woesearchaeota archaeon]
MKNKLKISVGLASCGIASGADEVYDSFKKAKDFEITLRKVGCIGMCYNEPIVEVKLDNFQSLMFKNVTKDDLTSIIRSIRNNKKHPKLFAKRNDGKNNKNFSDIPNLYDLEFYKNQNKLLTKFCGRINPEKISEYLEIGGYSAFKKALDMNKEEIINQVKESGLRGRGGAGFPTGIKWNLLLKNKGKKNLVCNFDEGDPGAFMNRVLVESNPHLLIEGLLIASYALSIKKAYIYTRAEYPLAVKRLKIAINQAKKHGLLDKVYSSFNIEMRLGAGAFVCGEETALIKSIEGEAGRPVPRPPYPAQSGINSNPTNINNVETLSNLPNIINNGSNWYKSIGLEKSTGTKMFSFSGDVKRTGYIEIPFGTNFNQILDMAGTNIDDVKAIQLGGPSGGFITPDNFDLSIDYESVKKVDAIVGSGSMVVINNDKNIVEVVAYFLRFIVSESCGKCTPCREGTTRVKELIEKIKSKKADINDLLFLKDLSYTIKETSLCGLGQTAPNPIISSLKHLKKDYLDLLKKKPIGSSQYLFIHREDCNGCDRCSTVCPVAAISGKKFEIHSINQDACIKCGHCYNSCPTKAIEIKNYDI